MYITSTTEPRTVVDYEFVCHSGYAFMHTIDEDLGDTVAFGPTPLTVTLYLAEKASITDPEIAIPAEEITVFLTHVVTMHKRPRIVHPTPPEQKFDLRKVIVSKSVN